MAKFSVAMGLAVFFGLATIGLMISTIILATDDDKSIETVTEKMYSVAKPKNGTNTCYGRKEDVVLPNADCYNGTDVSSTIPPQAGANVTEGYVGEYDGTHDPITTPYFQAGLCPVNVHWHLGTEHTSAGQYDEENGMGPTDVEHRRKLSGKARKGGQCSLYDDSKKMYTDHFEWKHCVDMEVGQTYEVHWPHSMHGSCGTPDQYQEPFYDGVFCKFVANEVDDRVLEQQIGVQAQVFVIVNDENYFYPNLFGGMIVDGEMGKDIAYYAGSTTGTSRNNEMCSRYGPITWQVDRTCNKISASSFDKMCADMKSQRDDMSKDLYAHGSRIVVNDDLSDKQHGGR